MYESKSKDPGIRSLMDRCYREVYATLGMRPPGMKPRYLAESETSQEGEKIFPLLPTYLEFESLNPAGIIDLPKQDDDTDDTPRCRLCRQVLPPAAA